MRTDAHVAVIIPAANAQNTIAETLGSVLAQSMRPREIVVVDDGSTDATVDRVRAVMKETGNLRLLRQPRSGPSVARNAAIAASKAALIAPLDADDIWHPDYLAECSAALIAHRNAGLAYAWHHLIDRHGRAIRGPQRFEVCGGGFGPMLLTNYVGNGSSAVYTRDAIEAVGGYEPPMSGWHGAEDYLLQLRIAARTPVVCVKRDLVGYRKAAGTLSSDPLLACRARQVAVSRALDECGPAPVPVDRWAAADAQRTLAVFYLQQRKWRLAARALGRAAKLDFPALLLDLGLRVRNALSGCLRLRQVGDRPLDWLMMKRLKDLAKVMPQGTRSGPAMRLCEIAATPPAGVHEAARPSLVAPQCLSPEVAHLVAAKLDRSSGKVRQAAHDPPAQ